MSLFLLVVAILIFLLGSTVCLAGRPSRQASIGLLLLAYVLPALFFLLALAEAPEDTTRFRVALLGFGMRGEENQSFKRTLGGDPERADVWIDRMGRDARLGELQFTPSSSGQGGRGAVTLDVADLAAGLVRRGRSDLVREIELQHGDVLTFTTDAGQESFTVERESRLLGADRDRLRAVDSQEVFELPGRDDKRIWRPLGVGEATFPLRGLLGRREELKSFLFHRPSGLSGRLFLVAIDPGITVSRGGEELEVATSRQIERPTSLHMMRLYRSEGDRPKAEGIADLRSFDLVPGRRSFGLLLHTPEIYTLRWDQLAELESTATREAVAGEAQDGEMRLGLAMDDWPVGDKHLHLKNASRAIAGQAIANLSLPRERPSAWREPFQLTTPGGRREVVPGEPFWLGGEHAAAVQVDLLEPPLRLAILTLILAFFKAVAAHAARVSKLALGFLAAVEILVILRVLLAYRVWAMPPFHGESMDLSLIAWALLPWGLLVASLPNFSSRGSARAAWSSWLPTLGGWLFSMAWCVSSSGGGTAAVIWVSIHLALLLLPALRQERIREAIEDGASGLRRAWGNLAAKRRWLPERAVLGWSLAALLPLLGRFALLFAGFRESIFLGGVRVSLNLIHLPLALLIQAGFLIWLWRRVDDRGRLSLVDLIPGAVMIVGLWVAPAALVGDFGLLLLNIPVFLLALASFSLAAWRLLGRTWSGSGLTALVPLLAVLLYGFIVGTPAGTRTLLAVYNVFADENPNDPDRNLLRALQFAKPEEIEQKGLKASEELAIMATVMSKYTTGPNSGRGYFGTEISPHLRATALREHVPAIFVAGEWGWWGSCALVMLFIMAFFAGRALWPWHSPTLRGSRHGRGSTPAFVELAAALAALAACTFAVASLYMILATYGLTLFTGRNTYLLGLDSTADILESLSFGLLFAWGAAAVSEEEGP